MEALSRDANLIFQKDGLYVYEAKDVASLKIVVEANTKVQVVVEMSGTLDMNVDATMRQSSSARILFINKSIESNVVSNYHIQEDASLILGLYELHSGVVTNNTKVHLEQPFANAEVISTSLSKTKKLFDMECVHYVHDTYGDMKNYEISDEGANYKIIASGNIKKGAYGSKSHQMNRVLTLSGNQRSEAVPLLLIEENDVEASHANTMGKMAEEDLFYLQSRGISEESAKGLLVLSYVLPIADVIDDETWHDTLVEDIRSKVGL